MTAMPNFMPDYMHLYLCSKGNKIYQVADKTY